MEGKIIDTFRLIFVDIDQSYNIPVPDSTYQGYMTIRAPKGSTEAMYFPKGQTEQLVSMLGIPTADWPDIQDAIDFNNQYGLFVSAPPGSSADYPSYYGGVYLTKHGLFPFHQVTDKDNLSFRVPVAVESEVTSYLKNDETNAVIAPVFSATDSISITGIPSTFLATADSISFTLWGDGVSREETTYELILAGTLVQVEDPVSGSLVTVGSLVDDTLTITGTAGSSSFLYILFDQLLDDSTYKNGSGDWLSPEDEAAYTALVHAELVSRVTWVINIKDETYMSIAQKTPTEKETLVTISDIGYDQYSYDYSLSAYLDEAFEDTGPFPTAAEAENEDGLYVMFFDELAGTPGIYQSNGAATAPTNVTSSYRSRYIRVKGAGYMPGTANRDTGLTDMTDRIYYVNTSDALVLCSTALAPEGTQTPRTNVNYNTVTFSVTEEIYPGKQTSGGTFTGSLSETGKDTFGANIYFEEVLPETALSFVDVDVYKTFDDDVSAGGFFTGTRVVDSREYGGSTTVTTGSGGAPAMQGQRYVTKVVSDLIAEGTTGGVVNDLFTPVLLDGWVEARKNTYEPVLVFLEPTGHEALKEYLYSLRTSYRKMATMLAPRKLSGAERNDLESIVVTGRTTGFAQTVNEFLRKDTYTGKKYWTSLTGIYGTKCMRIMEGKLGGWAPMYTDIGGYGGQLAVVVEKAKYEFSADEQRTLDEKGLNPIILDSTYGVMVISQKTTQDPDNLSDWSYLGHSMAFDLFKREIRDNVMIPQIGKPNDSYYQAMRQRQCESILNRRIGGPQPIWAAGKVEISNVNTAEIKAQRKFKIKISVKVNVFSEWVELEFVNLAQSASV